jgi:basic amino acid/polyamine antiporter, APA family
LKGLNRRLGLGAVIAISMSAMLGSGIFVLPGIVVGQTGPGLWVTYLLSALCVLPAALSKSELATAMPSSGGTYVYLDRTFGPLVGTVAGLGLFLSLLLKSAFALVGFGAYFYVLAQVPLLPLSLGLLGLIVFLNILGVGKVSSALVAVVMISTVSMLALSTASLFTLDVANITPLFPEGLTGVFASSATVFVAFAGVTKVAAIAEEIRMPEKNLPRGILISLLLVTLIYVIVSFVLTANIPYTELQGSLKPIHMLAEKVGGHYLGIILSVIAVLTMVSMANAGILAASRFPFAMSRDNLLPAQFGQISSKYMTPVWSILLSGIIVFVIIIKLDVAKIAKLASSFMIMIYMAENIAVVILRETRTQWYKPAYRSWLYPWMQIFGIVSGFLLLTTMGGVVVTSLFSIAVPGVVLYMFYSRKRTDRKGVIGIKGVRRDLVEAPLIESRDELRLEAIDFSRDSPVVVAMFGKERSPEMLVELGVAFCKGEVIEVAHLTEVPEQTSLNDFWREPAVVKSLRRRMQALGKYRSVGIKFDPVVSHDIYKTVFEISQRLHCRWLITEWGGHTRFAFTIHNPMGWLKNHLSCHHAVFNDKGVRYIRKIMVVIQFSDNDTLAVDTADHLAKVYGADLCLVAVNNSGEDESVFKDDLESLKSKCTICDSKPSFLILTGKSKMDPIIEATADYDLVVIGGLAKEDRLERLFGSEHDKLMAQSACSVVSVL